MYEWEGKQIKVKLNSCTSVNSEQLNQEKWKCYDLGKMAHMVTTWLQTVR